MADRQTHKIGDRVHIAALPLEYRNTLFTRQVYLNGTVRFATKDWCSVVFDDGIHATKPHHFFYPGEAPK